MHVCCNLYLLIIPNKKKNDTSIEDLFDDSVLSVKLGGKSFTTENDYSNENFYGKNIFATAVIEKKKETIDFSGFNVIFNVIEAIQKDYLKLYKQQQIKRLKARLKKLKRLMYYFHNVFIKRQNFYCTTEEPHNIGSITLCLYQLLVQIHRVE